LAAAAAASDDEDSAATTSFSSPSSSRKAKAKAKATLDEPLPDSSGGADVTCYVLSRADFNELLGPLDEIIKAESKRRADELAAANAAKASPVISRLRTLSSSMFGGGSSPGPAGGGRATQASNTALVSVRKSTSATFAATSALFDLDRLDKIRKLGGGTFSEVFLVKDANNKFYAMKTVHKKNLMLMQQERSAFRERDAALVMTESHCPFVTALYATLQDDDSLYFVQQFVSGGDLWTLLYEHGGVPNKFALPLTKLDGLQAPAAQFYVSVVLNVMAHAHDQELVLRDIKPENWVIDGNGYLKIVDFGCAKVLPLNDRTCRTNTLCGCPEYASPEAVLGKGYNRSCDFWALGIFLFELMTRRTPFAHDNVGTLYQNIVNSEDVLKGALPSGLDAASKGLLLGLLEYSPVRRLGMLRNGIDEAWMQPFFKGTSMEQVDRKGSAAPYIPNVDEGGGGGRSGSGLSTADLDGMVDLLVVGGDEAEEDSAASLRYNGDYDFAPF
jgi:protein kinase A